MATLNKQKKSNKLNARTRRRARVRAKITGGPNRPRLAVFRSNRYIYAQLIDDVARRTLVAASDRGVAEKGTKRERAINVGRRLAEQAVASSLKQVSFDRGGYRFAGRVKALAEGAREGGLEF
jgi:large subunit ribosomal protein L18